MASVDVNSMLHSSVECVTIFGDVYRGKLEAIDGAFDLVLSSCTHRTPNGVDKGMDANSANAGVSTFVRGDNVMYIGFPGSRS